MTKSNDDGNEPGASVRVALAGLRDDATTSKDACLELVAERLAEGGHRIVKNESIGFDQKSIQKFLRESIENADIQAIIVVGGTGFDRSGVTLEAVLPFQEKTLPGFSELFRMLCFEEMGSSAIFVRAASFVSEGKVVFCIPRNETAARIAVDGLIVPQLSRAVTEAASSQE